MSHTSTTITAPVDVYGDIAYVLNESTGDVATLCKSNNIVKWAKYKPVEANVVGILSYDQRLRSNHGFNVSYGSPTDGGMCATTLSELFTKYGNNSGTWSYIKPSTWYRVLDFVPPSLSGTGYNAGALAPYTINPPSEHTSTVSTYTMSFTLNSRSAAEIPLSEVLQYNTAQPTLSNLKYAFAIKYTKNNATTYKIVKAKTMEATPQEVSVSGFTNGMSLQAEIELDGFRTYECLWCVIDTNFDTTTFQGFCVYLHDCGFNFELKQTTAAIRYTHAWGTSGYLSLTKQYAYDHKGEYVQCAAINFGTVIKSLLTTYDVAPEGRTLKLISTPIITYDGGDVYAAEPIVHANNINLNYGQIFNGYEVDSANLGTVLLLDPNNAGWEASRIDQVEVITQLDFADQGTMSIAHNQYSGHDHTDILTFN